MMNNAWKMNEGDKSYGKGWAGEDNAQPNYSGKPKPSPY